FQLARTWRRAGDFDAARAHLEQAERLGWVPEAVALEYQLIPVQSGVVRPYEQTLRRYLGEGHGEEKFILEALAAGCLQSNFLDEAHRWATLWAERHPGDWQAR